MNGHLVSYMAVGTLGPVVSTKTAHRFMSSTICSLDSGPLMAWLMGTLRDGPGQTPGVSITGIAQGLVRIFSSLSHSIRCMMGYFVMRLAINIPI